MGKSQSVAACQSDTDSQTWLFLWVTLMTDTGWFAAGWGGGGAGSDIILKAILRTDTDTVTSRYLRRWQLDAGWWMSWGRHGKYKTDSFPCASHWYTTVTHFFPPGGLSHHPTCLSYSLILNQQLPPKQPNSSVDYSKHKLVSKRRVPSLQAQSFNLKSLLLVLKGHVEGIFTENPPPMTLSFIAGF